MFSNRTSSRHFLKWPCSLLGSKPACPISCQCYYCPFYAEMIQTPVWLWTFGGWVRLGKMWEWWWGEMLFFNQRIWRAAQTWKPGGSEAGIAFIISRGCRKALICVEGENSTFLCHRPSLGWATAAQFHFSSFSNLGISELFHPLGACNAHSLLLQGQPFGASMWVGTLQHKGAVRPCWNGMLWGPGQRSSFLEKNKSLLLSHVCSTSGRAAALHFDLFQEQ